MINLTGPSLPHIHKDTHLKIYPCMLHAHIVNIIEPDCYEKELNATLTANKLPNIKIPTIPDSMKLINIMTSEDKEDKTETEKNKIRKEDVKRDQNKPETVPTQKTFCRNL